MDVKDVLADLLAEQAALDTIVAGLSDEQWGQPTPSARWDVGDQIAHLTYFDRTATLAITDEDTFRRAVEGLIAAAAGGEEAIDEFTLGEFRRLAPAGRLEAWRAGRRALADAAATLADGTRVIWYGPSMSSKSFLTARLMEVWAHGQDIVDTVGGGRPTTDRLRHIAQLGYITRGWTYLNRRLEAPEGDVRLELVAPSGDVWTWGEADDAFVRGTAEDFCLVVTQRRHLDDTALEVTGEQARDWLLKAQAFAGPPTDGPRPASG